MKMDPKRYTYQVRWSDDPKGYLATVVEFPHLSSIHPQGPAEALEILESKVYHELQWWEKQGDPPVRPVGQNVVTRRPRSVAEGFMVWDTVIWDTSSASFPAGGGLQALQHRQQRKPATDERSWRHGR